jgi:hypothetical protein
MQFPLTLNFKVTLNPSHNTERPTEEEVQYIYSTPLLKLMAGVEHEVVDTATMLTSRNILSHDD